MEELMLLREILWDICPDDEQDELIADWEGDEEDEVG